MGSRHGGPIRGTRNNVDVAVQGLLKFEHDEVVGVVQSAAPLIVSHRDPLSPDESQHGVTASDGSLNGLDEVLPRGNGVDVDEHARADELRSDAVGQPSGGISGFLSSITEEDAARGVGCSPREPCGCR